MPGRYTGHGGPRCRSAALGACVAMVLTFAGCDGSETSRGAAGRAQSASVASPEASTPAATGADAEVLAAYRSWLAALAAHDAAAACARHAPELTIALRQRAIVDHRAELGEPCTDFVAVLWEDPTTETDPTGIEITQRTGEDALLAVDFPEVDQTVRMIARHGGWYVASSTTRGAGADRWLGAWCSLAVGMDRKDVVELMGEPSGEYTVDNGGEPQLWWARAPYDFRAYLDVDGSVLELVGDYDGLSAADRDGLTCLELRN